MNIVDPILFQCRYNPAGAAICVPGTQFRLISYGRLAQFIHNITRATLAQGVARGDVVAVLIGDKILHAAVVLALTRLGAITVSARSAAIPKELNAAAGITDQKPQIAGVGRTIFADATWTMGNGKPVADESLYRSGGDDLCRIILTSGSTGAPKGVAVSHRALIARLQHYGFAKGNKLSFYSRLYCDLGVASSPGFHYMLYMLSRGGTLFCHDDDPMATVQSLDLYRVQSMIASPHGLASFLQFYETRKDVQCSLEHVCSTGGLVSKSLSQRIRARMTANFVCSYGASETSTVATAPAHVIEDSPGAVGFVVPGVTIEIVDGEGRALASGKEGTVRIRSPHQANGYVGDAAASQKAFRDGWFYPGDIGYLTPDKMLVIAGRDDTILNVGGDKVNPEAVEAALASFPGVAQAAAFSVTDALGIAELGLAIVAPSGCNEKALISHCEAQLRMSLGPVRVLKVSELPRTESGKIDRNRLSALVGGNG
jgi:acyl-coenzyme A synthetase/AMP-(fatty) acid ligase